MSRIPSLDDFVALVETLGFDLIEHRSSNAMFVLLDFRKNRAKPVPVAPEQAAKCLQPCIYKRR